MLNLALKSSRTVKILIISALFLIQAMSMTLPSNKLDIIGKHKRSLRSIANKFKQTKELSVIQWSQSSESFMKNLEEVIAANELVQIRLNVEKRKEAKEIGTQISLDTNSTLAQVVGHTVLLYRASSPPGRISKLLETES